MINHHYELRVSGTVTKAQLKKPIIEHLQEEELLSDSTDTEEISTMTGKEKLKLNRLEL